MPGFQRLRRTLCVVLVLGLAGAPLAPVFAGAAQLPSQAGATLHHVHSDENRATDASVDHAGCVQHDQCQGSCCSACAQCVAAMFAWPSTFAPIRTAQEFLVATLFSDPPVALLPRPPQSLS